MKKIICFCLLLSFILISCAGNISENTEHIIEKLNKNLSIGEQYTLIVRSVKDDRIMDNKELLWSSSDLGVASVSGEGVVSVNGAGFCVISARSKDNLELFSTVNIFSSYDTIAPVSEIRTPLNADEDPLDMYSVAGVALERYGRIAVSAIQGNMNSVIFNLVKEAFSKDVYWYSTTELDCTVKDGIVYTISDWGNSPVNIDFNNMNMKGIYKSTSSSFSESVEMGVTFNDALEEIKLSVAHQLPSDGVYHLDLMDSSYEYRVVIRGDYTACISRDHYSNGALSQLGDSISDIINWKLDDLVSRYAYTVVRGELLDLKNLRICIEIREK